MDVSRSLRFPSLNPNWLPALIIWMLLMVGIVTTPLAIGYLVRLVRNVARGNEFLPSYADTAQLYCDGLRFWLAGAVLVVPLLAVIIINNFCGNSMLDGDCGVFGLLAALSSLALGRVLNSLYIVVVVFILPMSLICVAYSPNWYAGVDFSLMRRLVGGNWLDYCLMVLVAYAISSLASFGILVFIVGALISIPYASFCSAHMYGTYLQQCLSKDDV